MLAEYLRDGTTADQRVAVLLYGITSSLMAVTFNLMWHYLLRHPEPAGLEVTRESLAVRNRRFNIGLLSYPVVTLVGLISVPLFLVLVFALAVLYLLPTPEYRVDQPQ